MPLRSDRINTVFTKIFCARTKYRGEKNKREGGAMSQKFFYDIQGATGSSYNIRHCTTPLSVAGTQGG
jgi:hypothetical protein